MRQSITLYYDYQYYNWDLMLVKKIYLLERSGFISLLDNEITLNKLSEQVNLGLQTIHTELLCSSPEYLSTHKKIDSPIT